MAEAESKLPVKTETKAAEPGSAIIRRFRSQFLELPVSPVNVGD